MLNYNTPPLLCHGQITLSNIVEICPLAIPNQISLISMHVPSLVKMPWYLCKLSSRNENIGMPRADTTSKFDEICPLAILNQICTISIHIPSLVWIRWCLLKLSSRNEIMADGHTTDRWTDRHMDVERETIIPRHYHVVRYKNVFQLFPLHKSINKHRFDLALKRSTINLWSSFEPTWKSPWCSLPRFSHKAFLVLEKKIFKSFYHIWTWQPSCSIARNHLNKLAIPFQQKANVKPGENSSSSFREEGI